MQKENAAAEEEMRKLREEDKQKEERILFLSDKVEKNRMAVADMAAELQGLQAGEEKEGAAMLRRQEIAAWRPYGSKLLMCVLQCDQTRSMPWANAVLQRFKENGAVQEQMPGRDERRRNSEDEQEQGRASQQVALPTPRGFIQGALASCLELDIPLVRGALGEGGSAGRSGTQGDRKRGPLRSPGRPSMVVGGDDDLGALVPLTKRERKTARERTQEPMKETVRERTHEPKKEKTRMKTHGPWEKAVKVGTSVLAKYPARERTREPLKHQSKGGGIRKSGKKRNGKGRRIKKETSEAQKKHLVGKAQRTIGEPIWVGKKR